MGLDESSFQNLETVVSRESLSFINDVQTAQVWSGRSDDQINRCLDVIEQKLSQQSKSGSQIELRTREMLARHTKQVKEQIVEEVKGLSDNVDDLSIPHEMLSLEGRRLRAMDKIKRPKAQHQSTTRKYQLLTKS